VIYCLRYLVALVRGVMPWSVVVHWPGRFLLWFLPCYGRMWRREVNIVVDKKTYKVLKLLYKKKRCTFKDIQEITSLNESKSPSKYISELCKNRFIEYWVSDELIVINGIKENKQLGYSISLTGEAYVEQRRREFRNFWVPYAITTFIAALSLIASISDNWGTILSWFGYTPG